MNVMRTGRDIIIKPSVHLATIVWLHGLGDSAEGFFDLFYDYPLIPNCKVVLPTAPLNPVTVNGGHLFNSWYDFKTMEDEYDPSAESSVEIILKILEEEKKSTDCLILGGFSQGAVMSLYTGLSKHQNELKAIVALSGYAFPMTIPDHKKSTPVLMFHGVRDTLITLERSNLTVQKHLQGVNLTQKTDETLGHSISLPEWNLVSQWLTEKINQKD